MKMWIISRLADRLVKFLLSSALRIAYILLNKVRTTRWWMPYLILLLTWVEQMTNISKCNVPQCTVLSERCWIMSLSVVSVTHILQRQMSINTFHMTPLLGTFRPTSEDGQKSVCKCGMKWYGEQWYNFFVIN